MRIYTIPFFVLFISNSLSGQNLPDDCIGLNTKFTLTLVASGSDSFRFSVKNKDTFDNTIDLTKASIFNNKVNTTEVEGILTCSKSKDKVQYKLILKSGLQNPLDYDLELGTEYSSDLSKTSVVTLFPQVISNELWPYKINYVRFSNFRDFRKKSVTKQQESIDSGDNRNRQSNIASGNELSSAYLDTALVFLSGTSGVQLNKAIEFEKSIGSIDVTREYFTSLGKDIYPNKKKFQLEKPAEFRRFESPLLQTDLNYYYTKDERVIKVILFEWNMRREQHDFFESDQNFDMTKKVFQEKFDSIANKLTILLGKPLETEFESKKGIDNFRDDIKWVGSNKLSAYLFMFGNSAYRQIRLAIYKD